MAKGKHRTYVQVGDDDRSNIIDLVSAYTRLYDEGQMDEFVSLFAEDVVVHPNFGSAMPEKVQGKNAVESFYRAARKQAHDAGTHPRHFSTNHLFTAFAKTHADIVVGMLYAEFANGRAELKFIGKYQFSVAQGADGWRIKAVSIKYDL